VARRNRRSSRHVRPLLLATVAVGLAVIIIVVVVVIAITRPNLNFETWVGLGGLGIAIIALVINIPSTVQAARGLRSESAGADLALLRSAIRNRWDEAARQRGLQDGALDIAWCDTERPVTRSTGRVLGATSDAPRTVTHLGAYWRALSNPRQLVVLGAPGAGKTSAVILLANDLLDDGVEENAPVPFPVNLSGWDPHQVGPIELAIDQLIDEFPDLRRKTASGVSAAKSLLESGRVLPFFDGLDETLDIAEAIRLINSDLRRHSFVISCLADEFEQALQLTQESLATAPVIELRSISPEQATQYLPTGNQLDGDARWEGVISQIIANPNGPLGTALSTPLMVYLAQVAYKSQHDADELLQFTTVESIEQRLLHAYIAAFYPRPRAPSKDRTADGRYTQRQAEKWLGFLASRSESVNSQAIAWWRLPSICGTPFRLWYTGLTMILAGFLVGGTAGIWYGLVVAAGIGVRIPASSDPVIASRRRSLIDIAVALLCGVFCGSIGYITGGLVGAIAIGIASTFVVKFAIEVYQRHGVDEDPRRPVDVVREDIKNSVQLALSAGISVFFAAIFMDGLLAAVAFGLVGAFAGGHAGFFDTGRLKGAIAGGLTYGTIGVASGGQRLDLNDGIVLALGVMSTIIALNAWYRSFHARLWLRASGKLPFAVVMFLENAADLGVLRRTGPVYRFRHRRIQTYLATSYNGSKAPEVTLKESSG
jgi:hypothetical protein